MELERVKWNGAWIALLTLLIGGVYLILEANDPPPTADYSWDYLDTHLLSGLRWPLGPLINCSTIHEVGDLQYIASGWTKSVYRAKFRGQEIAVKTVNLNGQDMRNCLADRGSLPICYRKTAAKVLKELVLLTELEHDNVIKVLGSCIPDAVGPVVLATELGEPLDSLQLLRFSWQDKMKLALGVARVLHHLAHSSLGSLAMADLRRQQFVLVNGELKLSDVDDLEISEPSCKVHTDCRPPRDQYNITDPEPLFCIRGHCEGHNERSNILRAGQHVIKQFLPLSVPTALEPHIKQLVDAYEGFKHWDSERILQITQSLVDFHS